MIGHEISHGFDDQGRKSDGNGVLRDWWTAEDAAKFKAQADRLGAQYSAFEPVPGVHIKGEPDDGREHRRPRRPAAWRSTPTTPRSKGKPAPVIDGLTGDQRFFLGWAQVWRQKVRPDAAIQQTKSDPHSAAPFRVIGPMRNNDGWYSAFDVTAGATYYLEPDQRVRIW